MKLLFVSNLFPDESEPYRGLDNATLLHSLSDRWEIRALALRPSLTPGSWSRHRTSRTLDRPFQTEYIPVPYIPKFGSRFNHLLAARALRKPLREVQARFAYDVVLGSWIYPDCCAIGIAAGELGFPFVAIAQGSDVHQYLQVPARREIICRWLPAAASIVTRSAELARLLAEAGVPRSKLHPVYNGIDFGCFQPGDQLGARNALGLPKDVPIILSVGNLLPIKNPLLLVEAHAMLCKVTRFEKCHLVMVGAGPLEAEVRARADALGRGDQVILAGRQDAASVAKYMQAANLLCLPSNNEGVPNVILEAFACGLPVVASRVGGIPEVHTDAFLGRLTPPGETDALCNALRSVLEGAVDRKAISLYARKFSWENTSAAYDALLHKAAGSLPHSIETAKPRVC